MNSPAAGFVCRAPSLNCRGFGPGLFSRAAFASIRTSCLSLTRRARLTKGAA